MSFFTSSLNAPNIKIKTAKKVALEFFALLPADKGSNNGLIEITLYLSMKINILSGGRDHKWIKQLKITEALDSDFSIV